MPRDNWCPQCGGMYHDDEMGKRVCIYCETGTDSSVEAGHDEPPEHYDGDY